MPKCEHRSIQIIDVDVPNVFAEQQIESNASASGIRLRVVAVGQPIFLHDCADVWGQLALSTGVAQRTMNAKHDRLDRGSGSVSRPHSLEK